MKRNAGLRDSGYGGQNGHAGSEGDDAVAGAGG